LKRKTDTTRRILKRQRAVTDVQIGTCTARKIVLFRKDEHALDDHFIRELDVDPG
jgi:hypothetical protein